MTPQEQWSEILNDGEKVLWQGQPDGGIYIHPSRRKSFRVSLLFCAVTAVIFLPFLSGADWIFWIFALFFGTLSLLFLLNETYFPARTRRYTFYTLTNRRAILGTAKPRAKPTLKFFDISASETYEHIPGKLGSIVFDHEFQGTIINDVKQFYAVGFMRFADSERVWQMVQDIQQQQREAHKGTSTS